jgi:hypothetical protein
METQSEAPLDCVLVGIGPAQIGLSQPRSCTAQKYPALSVTGCRKIQPRATLCSLNATLGNPCAWLGVLRSWPHFCNLIHFLSSTLLSFCPQVCCVTRSLSLKQTGIPSVAGALLGAQCCICGQGPVQCWWHLCGARCAPKEWVFVSPFVFSAVMPRVNGEGSRKVAATINQDQYEQAGSYAFQ